jgi:hypothetical protein
MASLGGFAQVTYDVPGPEVRHERAIIGVSTGQPGTYAVLTPDGDKFLEELTPNNDDLTDVILTPGHGYTPPGVDVDSIYRFREIPIGQVLEALYRDGAFMLSQAAPRVFPAFKLAVRGHAPALQVGALPSGPIEVLPHVGYALVPAGGAPPLQVASGLIWVAAEDLGSVAMGAEISPLPDGTRSLGDRGVVPWGQGHLLVRQIDFNDVYRFVRSDLRISPIGTTAGGSRRISFHEAMQKMDPTTPSGGLDLEGPATVMWDLENMLSNDTSPSRMASGACLSLTRVPKGKQLFGALSDVKDFFDWIENGESLRK